MGKHSKEYSAPAHKSTTIRGSYMSTDSAGVGDGLSARSDMDSENINDLKVNNETSVSGNPRGAIRKRKGVSVSEKGHKFDLGC